jgi:hypothetical protein
MPHRKYAFPWPYRVKVADQSAGKPVPEKPTDLQPVAVLSMIQIKKISFSLNDGK